MADVLPPDPYKAFDLPHTATSKEITSAYRKAALRCHPDKAPGKAEEFHRISSAYELLNDEEKKDDYDKVYERVQLLNKLKDELSTSSRRGDSVRGGSTTGRHSGAGAGYPPGVQIRTASFSFGVGGNGGSSSYFYGPTRVAEETSRRGSARSPPSSSDDRSAPKMDGFFGKAAGAAFVGLAEQVLQAHMRKQEEEKLRKASSQRKTSRSEDADRRAKSARDSAREQQEREAEKRRRDKDEAKARQQKYFSRPAAYEDSDSDNTYTARTRAADQRRDLDREKARYEEEKLKKSRRHTTSRDDDDSHDERTRRAYNDAQGYIYSVNPKSPSSPKRPSVSRQNTYTEDTYDSRTSPRAERPDLSRRTSTRQPESKYAPKEEKRSHERRVSDDASKRTSTRPQPPPLNTSNTSPASFRTPQSASPTASRRTKTFDIVDEDRAPIPGLRRSQTMPVERDAFRRSDTSRRSARPADTVPERGSNLRHAETNDSGYSTSSPSETPAPYFPTPPKTRSNAKVVDEDDVKRFMESSRPAMSRQPSVSRPRKSPEREERRPEKPTINTSFRAPPVARSASYARHFEDTTPISPTTSSSTRRPSLSRTDSNRHNSTSTRATSASEARTPGTPLKTFRAESYFDDISQSPADYSSSRDLPFRDDRDRNREKENLKRSSYAYAPSASAAEAGLKSKSMPAEYANVPIRDVRPSMPTRRESVSRGGSGAKSPLYEDLRARDHSGSSRERDREGGRRSGNSVAYEYDARRPSKRGI